VILVQPIKSCLVTERRVDHVHRWTRHRSAKTNLNSLEKSRSQVSQQISGDRISHMRVIMYRSTDIVRSSNRTQTWQREDTCCNKSLLNRPVDAVMGHIATRFPRGLRGHGDSHNGGKCQMQYVPLHALLRFRFVTYTGIVFSHRRFLSTSASGPGRYESDNRSEVGDKHEGGLDSWHDDGEPSFVAHERHEDLRVFISRYVDA
jgi:hypothetical protein